MSCQAAGRMASVMVQVSPFGPSGPSSGPRSCCRRPPGHRRQSRRQTGDAAAGCGSGSQYARNCPPDPPHGPPTYPESARRRAPSSPGALGVVQQPAFRLICQLQAVVCHGAAHPPGGAQTDSSWPPRTEAAAARASTQAPRATRIIFSTLIGPLLPSIQCR